jgi:hypothetical protein
MGEKAGGGEIFCMLGDDCRPQRLARLAKSANHKRRIYIGKAEGLTLEWDKVDILIAINNSIKVYIL